MRKTYGDVYRVPGSVCYNLEMVRWIKGGWLIVATVSALAGAQDASHGKYFIEGFAGKSLIPFLGSEDPRSAHGFGFGMIRHTPAWLRTGKSPSDMWSQVYYHRSTSPGFRGRKPNGTEAIGLLTTVRYWAPVSRSVQAYFEIGAGLHYVDMRTEDIPSRLSSTPVVGLGLSFRTSNGDILFGARLLHISNAGFVGSNQGQNQLLVTVGFRF